MSSTFWLESLKLAYPSRKARRRAKAGQRPKPLGRKLSVEVLEDRSLPSFLGPINYAAGSNPIAVVAGDFNNDTVLDLAVANYGSHNVSVFLGHGDGTFRPAVDSATGTNPLSIAVGDFNRDGKLDLATANVNDVSVLLGNGDGTFQAPSSIGLSDGSSPESLAVGDFNGDGKLDLGVTSNLYHPGYWGYYNFYPGYYTGSAHVLIGNGLGSFSDTSSASLGYGYHASAAVADFNGDGNDDFAAADRDTSTVSVLLGDGTGNFSGPADFSAGGAPLSVTAGDLNGDGRPDLVTANGYYNTVGVLLNDSLGGFAPAHTYGTGGPAGSVAIADFNHDGHTDVATSDYADNRVSVVLGRGDGTFSPAVTSPTGSYPNGVAAKDFNGDGWCDLVTANNSGGNASVLINDHSWPSPDAPSVNINDVTVTEGNTGSVNATFTVSLSAAYSEPVTVHYQTANGSATAGSDYIATSGDVTIPANTTTQTVTVAVLGDRIPEYTENFFVNLSGAPNAFITDSQGVGTILDDEPRISINDVSKLEGNRGTTAFVFTVSLSVAYDEPVTVNFATADGTAKVSDNDYIATSGTLTFAPGETTKTITVLVNGDKRNEPNEWFAIDLSGASSNALISDSQGIGWILNDDHGKH
jgi:hypothetical protein